MDRDLIEQLEESRYLKKTLKVDPDQAGETRWLKKAVHEARKISLATEPENIYHEGPGRLLVCYENTMSGEGSLKLTVPMSPGVKSSNNRSYAVSEIFRQLGDEDITRFNRISLWINAEAPGFHCLYYIISIHNSGEHIMPLPGRFEGTHNPCLSPGKWHHVVWEIPYIYRDHVSAISFGVSLSGSLPECADEVSVYFDGLQLETVDEENYLGFDLRKNSIAYCHSGYRSCAVKQALVQYCDADSFYILDRNKKRVFDSKAKKLDNEFKLLDFTSFDLPGRYTLHIGDLSTNPFYVGDDAYLSAAWKTLNFFYSERCGADIPGIHSICHQDVMCVHPDGRKINISGGWHDAGDLSQSLLNTSESAFAMLELAQSVREKEPKLYERLLEEARWGLNWVMRTRFGDGFRNGGCLTGIWTKNVIGDKDDMTSTARNNAAENFSAAALCARAACMYADDGVFSNWCLKSAREDYGFACDGIGVTGKNGKNEAILYSQAAIAGYELFIATDEKEYLELAAKHVRVVMACQQIERRRDINIPLRGFFYENRSRKRILAFFHKSYEHAPLQALTCLYRIAPDHPDANLWKGSIEAYGDYLKATAGLVAPYNILPNAIYEVDNTDFSDIYHEGDHSVGQPTLAEYNEQVKNGIKLSDTHYLRRFPVAYQFRGFHATIMSKAKAAAYVFKALGDRKYLDIAVRQMEWILGFNPFAMSSVYGEGYDFPPLYVGFSDQLTGAVPVGFETFENLDLPFFPMQVAPTYKEVWVHTTCRLMWLIADLY